MNVLIVEDLPTDAELCEREIRKALGECEFRRVETREDYLSALEAHRPELIVSDYRLPAFDGLAALRLAKERAADVPFIIVTGSMNEDTAVDCMKAGAWDYVIKGHIKRLGPAVTAALEEQRIRRERRQAEIALQASEARLKGVFEGVTDGIMLLDAETLRITAANPGIRELLGYTESELLDLSAAELHPREDWPGLREHFGRTIRGERTSRSNVPVKRRDGRVFYADINLVPTSILGKRVLVVWIRDATERRNLQATLAQSDRLSCMGMLAAGVAHEIKNPLSYILYSLESLLEDLPAMLTAVPRFDVHAPRPPAPTVAATHDDLTEISAATIDEVLGRLRDALEGSRRIREISRGLCTFSRVEDTKPVRIDVQQAIEHALSMACNEIKHRAKLVRGYERVPMVLGSDGKLAQVFLNLLMNASHAIGEGSVGANQIRVRTWAQKQSVFAEVADTGRGIRPEDRGRIFEPFFTTKGPGVGSGLGLSICRRIIEGFGGKISFDSEVDRGTRFVVELPAASEEYGLDAPPSGPIVAAAPFRARLLIVDDDPGILKVMRRILEREHDVVQAGSGKAAQDLLEVDQRFDLLLVDLIMPEGSGLELFEWLRPRNASLAQRIVFVTSGGFTSRAREFLASVENARVEKPFDSGTLRQVVIEKLMAARRGPDL